MKYLIILLGLIVTNVAKTSMAETCEEIMLKAGYDRTQFSMMDKNTIELFSLDPQNGYASLVNLKAPQCNLFFLGSWLHIPLEEDVELHTIDAVYLQNDGKLKASSIRMPPKMDNFLKKLNENKVKPVEIPKELKQQKPEPVVCRLENGENSELEVDDIDIRCSWDVALHNMGLIKAKKIRVFCLPGYDDSGCTGIFNLKGTITAQLIIADGVTGIENEPDGKINAEIIRAKGYGMNNDLYEGDGIVNLGEIVAKNVTCCAATTGECYKDSGIQYNNRFPVGNISTKVQNSCPNGQTLMGTSARVEGSNTARLSTGNATK